MAFFLGEKEHRAGLEDTSPQSILDTGQQHPKQHKLMRLQNINNSFSIRVDPDFLASLPYADDSDEDECVEDMLRFGDHDLSSSDFNSLSATSGSPRPAPSVPVTPYAQSSSQAPVFTFAEAGVHQHDDDDDVFQEHGIAPPVTPAQMFAEMTSRGHHRRSSDPAKYKPASEKDDPKYSLLMTHSLPLAAVKTYSCVKEYKQEEKREINRLMRELNITLDSGSEARSRHEKKQHPKNKNLFQSIRRGFSFSKKSVEKKRHEEKKRASHIDDLLCSSGNSEDRADVPYYRHDSAQALDELSRRERTMSVNYNGSDDDNDDDGMDDRLKGMLLRGVREPQPGSVGTSDAHSSSQRSESTAHEASRPTRPWLALKSSITSAFRPSSKTIHKHCLLLLQAPKKKGFMDYEQDKEARKKQYESFCELYPGLTDHSVQKTEEVVKSFQDIEHCIKKFFKKGASHAIMAVIIFNGHGGSNGLKLSDDKPVSLDTFITKVETLLEEHRAEHNCRLPHLIKIVFSQCYGHLYTEPHTEDIQIISFTSSTMPKTQSQIKRDPLTLEVTGSTHTQLNSFASRSCLTEDTLHKIRTHSRNISVESNFESNFSVEPMEA